MLKIRKIIAVMVLPLLLYVTGCSPTDQDGTKAEFNWKSEEGKTISVFLTQHPYTDAIIKKLPDFEEKTGITVDYILSPEDNYFNKLSLSFESQNPPDVYMTGVYQLWEYVPNNYVQELDEFINDLNLTDSSYDIDDFYPNILDSLKWNSSLGHRMGKGSILAVPMGFEQYVLAYNKRIFAERGLKPPKTINDLLQLSKDLHEFDGKGTYALALRGIRSWTSVHPGYMSTYVAYGAKDFELADDKLISVVNSPEAVEATDKWVEIIKKGASPSWQSYTWYQASADFGAGRAAMLYDADAVGYFQNVKGYSKEAGNIAWVTAPLPYEGAENKSNLWIWNLAMNKQSKEKNASWLFMQYFTNKEHQLWSALEVNGVNTPRQSVFNNPKYTDMIAQSDNYIETFNQTIEHASIQFMPQPYFTETTDLWAGTIQDLVASKYKSTQEGMDVLKEEMDKALNEVKVK
ncbi:hypothetical protein BJL90_00865 [Clostridium formicaceticum]|nr:hypothetical protein BJL90_00865 [Clostridium formicaceticum]